MQKIDRRKFLTLTGGASIAAAAGAITPAADALAAPKGHETITFRAVTGLPPKPLAHYASYVVEGHVNLATRTGMVTRSVFAGAPGSTSNVALPDTSSIVRITDVKQSGKLLRITGVIDDSSQVRHGEGRSVRILIDRGRQAAAAEFRGNHLVLRLEN